MRKLLVFGFGFLAVFLILNLIILDFFVVTQRNSLLDLSTRVGTLSDSFRSLTTRIYGTSFSDSPGTTGVATSQTNFPSGATDSCSSSCVGLIQQATAAAAKAQTSTTVYTPTTTTTKVVTNNVSKGEFFIPLGSGTVSSGNDWADITTAQANFDAANFGSIKSAYFEVFMRTDAGQVSARLFDSSTPAILFSSQVTNSTSSTAFISAPITLSAGNKNYRVQMKSTIGTGILDQARVRIIVQ